MEIDVSWDWAVAAQIVSSAVSVGTLIIVLSQMKLTQKLARESSFLNFVAAEEVSRLESDLDEALLRRQIPSVMDRHQDPLEPGEVHSILQDTAATRAVNAYLNHLQNLAVAREFGLVRADIWEKVHGARLRWWSSFLAEYVRLARIKFGDPAMWDLVRPPTDLHTK